MLPKLARVLTIALAVAAIGTSAFAQGTMQQQNACRPDVFRLCGSRIPNVEAIVACLRDNAASLSEPCHEVIFPGTADQGSYEQAARVRAGEIR
ncbi:hypothetical protein [Bradyrhizobium sp.]|uniref:hypothetical protein n=1 Tax=Bradyrhizobium sp. TaxID=376 RepID=UPI0039E56CF2